MVEVDRYLRLFLGEYPDMLNLRQYIQQSRHLFVQQARLRQLFCDIREQE